MFLGSVLDIYLRITHIITAFGKFNNIKTDILAFSRWDKCTNERQQTLNAHHGFSYTIHAEWDAGLLNLKFWRAEITDQDYMIVNNAHIPDSQLIITHTRGITVVNRDIINITILFQSINDNTIKYSAIVRAIEAPVPLSGGSPIVHREPPPVCLNILRVSNRFFSIN